MKNNHTAFGFNRLLTLLLLPIIILPIFLFASCQKKTRTMSLTSILLSGWRGNIKDIRQNKTDSHLHFRSCVTQHRSFFMSEEMEKLTFEKRPPKNWRSFLSVTVRLSEAIQIVCRNSLSFFLFSELVVLLGRLLLYDN